MIDDDYLVYDSDDDAVRYSSSEDEFKILLHGSHKQKRRLSRTLSEGSLDLDDVPSSGDEFEKEMAAELDDTMRSRSLETQQQTTSEQMEVSNPLEGTSSGTTATAAATRTTEPSDSVGDKESSQFYDDIYFDSDEEEGGSGSNNATASKEKDSTRGKRKVLTNDELFYDPDIDLDNEKWVSRQRERYRPSQGPPPRDGGAVAEAGAGAASGTSDAVLNCPACMTTLCLDCQRHELYGSQFRAMFVLNCKVLHQEVLKYPVKGQEKRRRHRRRRDPVVPPPGQDDPTTTFELYHPVRCAMCDSEVAVYDSDEVYHFFNVLASAP